ncbi:hypothetical protein ACOME3_009369 [Neoechinorhynchus agilis]
MITFSGLLMKYTNVMKGWQNRYFILDETNARLQYYLPEDMRRFPDQTEMVFPDIPPRCVIGLENSSVSLSTDDLVSFTVTPLNGESIRLKAFDEKERKVWVDKIRHASSNQPNSSAATIEMTQNIALSKSLAYSDTCHQTLISAIHALPNDGVFGQLDKDVLSVKASSVMCLMILHDCFRYVKCQRKSI